MSISAQAADLRTSLVARIAELAQHRGLEVGGRLTEGELAREFKVSRTPVRAALQQLVDEGALEIRPKQGYFLRIPVEALAGRHPQSRSSEEESLYLNIARDRIRGDLPDRVAETWMLRRYETNRAALRRVLIRMTEEGSVERSPAHGWIFQAGLTSPELVAQSFRFRLLIEPAGILEPTFNISKVRLRGVRDSHERFLEENEAEVSLVNFFEMNRAFHDLVAEASGNHFIHQAVQQQSRLRRFLEYDVNSRRENRSMDSCREHLRVIDALLQNDRELASSFMRLHLETAMRADAFQPQARASVA